MKKVIIFLCLSLAFILTGCFHTGRIEGGKRVHRGFNNEYFDLVCIYENENYGSYICYDGNTGVMYALQYSGRQFGITPIYNADGSLKLYNK